MEPTDKAMLIGVDIGQAQDYTAISVIEASPTVREKLTRRGDRVLDEPVMSYRLRYLERPELGTPYPLVVDKVADMVMQLGEDTDLVNLVVDVTGVGAPVRDYLQRALRIKTRGTDVKVKPAWITITGGHDWHFVQGSGLRVPKRDLVTAGQVAMQNGDLKIPRNLPLRQVFVEELRNFKVKINVATAHDSYEAWREGDHDDLVLSVVMPLWVGETFLKPRPLGGGSGPPGGPETPPPPDGPPPPGSHSPVTRTPLPPDVPGKETPRAPRLPGYPAN